MVKRLIVFDFDLTLADSSQGVYECMNLALAQMAFQSHSFEQVKRTIGHTLADSFQLLTGVSDKTLADQFVKIYVAHADKLMNVNTKVYNEVFQVLPLLKKWGITAGIVSTKYRYRIEEIILRDKLSGYFDFVIGGEDVSKHKPDPEGLLKAIQETGKNKKETLYVGDSLVDWETAKNAAVDFCAVLTGSVSEEEFCRKGATVILKKLDKLPGILELS